MPSALLSLIPETNSLLTGFDPALPLFDDWTNTVANVIDPSDATFVDIYHTNVGYKGKKAAGGTVDVYFNNGVHQPGCNCSKLQDSSAINFDSF